jgi:hypothetical protein
MFAYARYPGYSITRTAATAGVSPTLIPYTMRVGEHDIQPG